LLKAISPTGITVTIPLSVCLSVCHVRALCSNGRRYRHDFFCIQLSPFAKLLWPCYHSQSTI